MYTKEGCHGSRVRSKIMRMRLHIFTWLEFDPPGRIPLMCVVTYCITNAVIDDATL